VHQQVARWSFRGDIFNFPKLKVRLLCPQTSLLVELNEFPQELRQGTSLYVPSNGRSWKVLKVAILLCSSGTFLAAHQDSTGSLDWVEKAIAEATMVPIEHGEVSVAGFPFQAYAGFQAI
jgi:hypothetical protein